METTTFSIQEFCEASDKLMKEGRMVDFIRLNLNLVYENRQVVLDPVLNRIRPEEHHPITIYRDFDSLIGIHKDILVEGDDLVITPLPDFRQSLKKNIHIAYNFTNDEGSFSVPPHKIPNIAIGKWKVRNSVRILFPDLYSDDRQSFHMLEPELKQFYELGIRPTIIAILGERGHILPATYESEMFRARGLNGQISFASHVFPGWGIPKFGDLLRSTLVRNRVDWARNLVFLHEIRGVKNSSYHNLQPLSTDEALAQFLAQNGLPQRILLQDNFYIDIGVELHSSKGDCLAWRTDSHHLVVKELTGMTTANAQRLTKPGSSKYSRDLLSHMPAVSGCRIETGARGRGLFEVQYLQLYHTDKMLTARSDGFASTKTLNVTTLIAGKADKWFDQMYRLYIEAAGDSVSSARAEMRIGIAHAEEALIQLDLDCLSVSLVAIPCVYFWTLRAYRIHALRTIADWQICEEGPPRRAREALLLTAAVSWLASSINSTIDTRNQSRALIRAIMPRLPPSEIDSRDILVYQVNVSVFTDEAEEVVEQGFRLVGGEEEGGDEGEEEVGDRRRGTIGAGDEDTDEEDIEALLTIGTESATTTVPVACIPFGLLTLRELKLGDNIPVPRFTRTDTWISPECFYFYFRCTEDQLSSRLVSPTEDRNPMRTSNKKRQRPMLLDNPPAPIFDLASQGHEIGQPAVDEGSDNDEPEEILPSHRESTLDAELSRLWRQFLFDILSLSPNAKSVGQTSYITLTPEEREAVTIETFQTKVLSDVWRDCRWKLGDRSEWRAVFDRLWPRKGQRAPSKAQNYSTSSYYPDWIAFTSISSEETVEAARKGLFEIYNTAYWMPRAESDRIWRTNSRKGFRKNSPYGLEQAAPNLILNGTELPQWN